MNDEIYPPSPVEPSLHMTVSFEPWYDSSNSYPPHISFEEKNRTIEISLKNPDRVIQLKKNDFLRMCEFFKKNIDV